MLRRTLLGDLLVHDLQSHNGKVTIGVAFRQFPDFKEFIICYEGKVVSKHMLHDQGALIGSWKSNVEFEAESPSEIGVDLPASK